VARAITLARRAEVLGPVPAVPGRVGFRLLVKVPRDLRLDRLLARDRMEAPRVSVRVDVDPLDVA
jgi:primosomal protein N'